MDCNKSIAINPKYVFAYDSRGDIKTALGDKIGACADYKKAKEAASRNNINLELIDLCAEDIPLEENSVDTIVITYTLCSIDETETALKEFHRVLKSDGTLIFCEHGQSPDRNILNWQNRINPIWGKLFGGCNINRDIPNILKESGFKINTLDQMYLPSTPKIVGYNYWGEAIR